MEESISRLAGSPTTASSSTRPDLIAAAHAAGRPAAERTTLYGIRAEHPLDRSGGVATPPDRGSGSV